MPRNYQNCIPSTSTKISVLFSISAVTKFIISKFTERILRDDGPLKNPKFCFTFNVCFLKCYGYRYFARNVCSILFTLFYKKKESFMEKVNWQRPSEDIWTGWHFLQLLDNKRVTSLRGKRETRNTRKRTHWQSNKFRRRDIVKFRQLLVRHGTWNTGQRTHHRDPIKLGREQRCSRLVYFELEENLGW